MSLETGAGQCINEKTDVERNLELSETLELTVETLAEQMREFYSNKPLSELRDMATGELLLIAFM